MIQKSKNNWLEREIYPQVLDWLKEPEIIAIAGPRQAGKTTLLFQLQKELKEAKTIYVNFEETSQIESFLRSPQQFVSLAKEEGRKTYFLFDEFQYVEDGGKILKLLYDQFCPSGQVKFIITGSASLQIREMASFLVGRVIFLNLYPFSFGECLSFKDKRLFNLWKIFHSLLLAFLNNQKAKLPEFIFEKEVQELFGEYLLFGGYPAVATSEEGKREPRLNALIETYIEKDIIKYLRVGNFLGFKNLTRIVSVQIGNLANYTSLGSDSGLSFPEIKNFLGVLEQTFVVKLLPPYFSNKITEIKKSPKIYFFDLGLRNSLISDFRDISLRQDKGAMVENFAFQNFTFRSKTSHLNFWRTKQGSEIDLVLRYQNEVIPMEVKYQDFTKPKLSRSFFSFLDNYPSSKGVVLTKNFTAIKKFGKTKILFLPVYFV